MGSSAFRPASIAPECSRARQPPETRLTHELLTGQTRSTRLNPDTVEFTARYATGEIKKSSPLSEGGYRGVLDDANSSATASNPPPPAPPLQGGEYEHLPEISTTPLAKGGMGFVSCVGNPSVHRSRANTVQQELLSRLDLVPTLRVGMPPWPLRGLTSAHRDGRRGASKMAFPRGASERVFRAQVANLQQLEATSLIFIEWYRASNGARSGDAQTIPTRSASEGPPARTLARASGWCEERPHRTVRHTFVRRS